ncbi:MAG: type II toxin-antitoxin system RelE/ParE family toxin [Gammaproteobacteria bacterium]|nr:type II toxin-antitoxin system RelE/ParE family toxin [Gammaproteobacteria bacterium]
MYRILYRKAAAKTLSRMPKSLAEKFLKSFEQIAGNSGAEGLDIKPLSGREGYRLRIGQWRAIYRIEGAKMTIEILRIGPRGDVYK